MYSLKHVWEDEHNWRKHEQVISIQPHFHYDQGEQKVCESSGTVAEFNNSLHYIDADGNPHSEYSEGTYYVMNELGKTIAVYHLKPWRDS